MNIEDLMGLLQQLGLVLPQPGELVQRRCGVGWLAGELLHAP